MLDTARGNRITLPTYSLEKRKDGWYFSAPTFFSAPSDPKGPYSSIMSACLMIARELAREAVRKQQRKRPTLGR
jgi:hypothetical protein